MLRLTQKQGKTFDYGYCDARRLHALSEADEILERIF